MSTRHRLIRTGISPWWWPVTDDLPADQRQLLVLRFYTDLTVPQIADVLGVAQGTVKSRLHAAVGQMRSRLSAKGVE